MGFLDKVKEQLGMPSGKPEENAVGENIDLSLLKEENLFISGAPVEEVVENSSGSESKSDEESDEAVVAKYVAMLVDHFVRHGNEDFKVDRTAVDNFLNEDEARRALEASKGRVMAKVDFQLREKQVPRKYRDEIRKQFECYRWGYYILEPLLHDPEISDIMMYDYDRITIKKLGRRYNTVLRFRDRQEYVDYISLIMTRNGVGQSNNNAVAKFTDTTSNAMFRLRFDVLLQYVTSFGLPLMHIRLIPKDKRSVEILDKRYGMFPPGTREYIEERIRMGEGFLITGKNGSGKTTLLNAVLDTFNPQKKVMVIEDNQELFSDVRGEIMFTHSVESRADGKIVYGLSDLAEEGLLCDIDIMIVGEIKNESARGLMKAAYVGVQCFSTSHGSSAVDGYYKLADYVKQATTYDLVDCLRFLIGFKNLIRMDRYKIDEIVHVDGWDDNKGQPIFREVFNSVNQVSA